MPVIKRPAQAATVELPPRKAIDAGETDVLVVGGGPAGLGAAVGAAQSGVRVVLIEHYGFLGGNATAALVVPLASYHRQRPTRERPGTPTLTPTDHGDGRAIIGGVLSTFVNRLVQAGGAIPPSRATGYVVPFDPEIFKAVAFDLLDEHNVHYLLHAFSSDIIVGRNRQAVVLETKSGPLVLRARVIVDCTGDGDVAAKAGASYRIGRDADGLVQPMTLMFRMAAFDRQAFAAYAEAHPSQWLGVHGLWDLIRTVAEAGHLKLPREDILFFATTRDEEISVNSTRIVKVLGTDVWDLAYAEREGRRQIGQIAAFLRKYVPGFERSHVDQSGTTVGIRETRRIRGEYELTADDLLACRKFEDVIAHGSYPIDIHNPSGSGTILKHLPPGGAYDIPLRCLIPKDVENFLVAGRCISGTHEALSSYRVMPISMATGQAAGVCAALSVLQRVLPRQVEARDVQRVLLEQKAILFR